MTVCTACSSNYDDNFKFCPYCGQIKSEFRESVVAKIQISTPKFEEAVLRLELVKKTLLNEPPFDFSPGFLSKIWKDFTDNWKEMNLYRLALVSIHPEKGEYTPYTSGLFGIFSTPFKLPPEVAGGLVDPSRYDWLRKFFSERKQAWDELNSYLIREGWMGITNRATNRKPPFKIEFPFISEAEFKTETSYRRGTYILEKSSLLSDDEYLVVFKSFDELMEGYRFRRQLSTY